MLINAAEEVGSSMYVEHNPFAFLSARFPPSIVPSHLNPFSFQCAAFPSPLPPFLPSNLINTVVSQLRYNRVRCSRYAIMGYFFFVDLDPAWAGHPLRRETLEILNGVAGCMNEELTNQIHTFMIRDMSSRLLVKGLPIEILPRSIYVLQEQISPLDVRARNMSQSLLG